MPLGSILTPGATASNLLIAAAGIFPRSNAEVAGLMETIDLTVPCCPTLRWAVALGAFAIPLLRDVVRPVVGRIWRKEPEPGGMIDGLNKTTGSIEATVGLGRDLLNIPAIAFSFYFGQGNSIDCYGPEIVAGVALALSLGRRVKLWIQGVPWSVQGPGLAVSPRRS